MALRNRLDVLEKKVRSLPGLSALSDDELVFLEGIFTQDGRFRDPVIGDLSGAELTRAAGIARRILATLEAPAP